MKAKELLGIISLPKKMNRSELLTSFYEHCSAAFKVSEEVQSYSKSRGLKGSYAYQDSHFHQGKSEEQINHCLQLGLLKAHKGIYRSFASSCLLFPLKDAKGRIVSLYGRSTKSGNTKNKHFYLKYRRGLYPSYPSKTTKKLLLVESVIDAASLEENKEVFGEEAETISILALYGVNGLSEEHQAAIKSLPELEEIILFMDGDMAGEAAVRKLVSHFRQLFKDCVSISQINTPQGEDPNSLLISHSKEVYGHLFEERTFLFSREVKENVPVSSEEKKKDVLTTPNMASAPILDTSEPACWRYESASALYLVKGGLRTEKVSDFESLKVSLEVRQLNKPFLKSRLKLDLYEDRQSEKAALEVAEKLGLRCDLVLADLSVLTDLLEVERQKQLQAAVAVKPVKNTLSPVLRQKALRLLRQPSLLNAINQLIAQSGMVGEEQNRLFLLGIASSYKQPKPLNALIQGSSGSGKTHLLQQISRFIPEADRLHFTRVTEGSFYNYGEWDLHHKALFLEDLDGLKEEALFALRELKSNGKLFNSTTVKDANGHLRSGIRAIRGPVASLSATTQGSLYEDNMSRCFVVAVDESAAQTQRILAYQNAFHAGELDPKAQAAAITLLQSAVSVLAPCEVINPYATKVALPQGVHKIRRLNSLYQCYVQQLTWLHQHQRSKDAQGRLLSEPEDLKTACELMFESILLKADELDGSLRQFYERLKDYLKNEGGEGYTSYTFGQREVRHALGVSKTQLHRYLQELQSLEYILQVGGHANRGYQYKVIYWDDYAVLRRKLKSYLNEQLEELV
ncbi:MAG: toprim domain-containing protein [Bacteroidota bacterium]